MERNDQELFRQAMAEVDPLRPTPKVTFNPKKPRIKIAKSLTPKRTQWQLDKVNSAPIGNFDTMSYQVPGLRKQDWLKLYKGQFKTIWQLDLHGLLTADADQYLKEFIDQAWSNQARYLIIVHGKGYNSETEHPVLKNLVHQRLQQNQQVLAFCSAQPKDGGTGAVYVLLKK